MSTEVLPLWLKIPRAFGLKLTHSLSFGRKSKWHNCSNRQYCLILGIKGHQDFCKMQALMYNKQPHPLLLLYPITPKNTHIFIELSQQTCLCPLRWSYWLSLEVWRFPGLYFFLVSHSTLTSPRKRHKVLENQAYFLALYSNDIESSFEVFINLLGIYR